MMKKLAYLLGVLCLSSSLLAQNSNPLTNKSPEQVNRGSNSKEDYKIQPLDVLSIYVFDVPQLTLDIAVNASGTIDYFFFKNLSVKGKTLSEVAKDLEYRLGLDYIVNPQVVVSIKEYRERTVSVLGAVNKEGQVVMPTERDMDILDAIALAEGFSRVANKKKIQVIRNGTKSEFTFDQMRNTTNEKDRFILMPGDIVYVGESFF